MKFFLQLLIVVYDQRNTILTKNFLDFQALNYSKGSFFNISVNSKKLKVLKYRFVFSFLFEMKKKIICEYDSPRSDKRDNFDEKRFKKSGITNNTLLFYTVTKSVTQQMLIKRGK